LHTCHAHCRYLGASLDHERCKYQLFRSCDRSTAWVYCFCTPNKILAHCNPILQMPAGIPDCGSPWLQAKLRFNTHVVSIPAKKVPGLACLRATWYGPLCGAPMTTSTFTSPPSCTQLQTLSSKNINKKHALCAIHDPSSKPKREGLGQ